LQPNSSQINLQFKIQIKPQFLWIQNMRNSDVRTFQTSKKYPAANFNKLALAIAIALLALESGRAQAAVLGTEDFIASGGISDVFHEFHPTLAIAPAATGAGPGSSAPATNAPLFIGTSITPADVGQTFTVTSGNDPNFNEFATALASGNPHKVTLSSGLGTLGTSQIFSTKSGDLFGGNPDLNGNTINSISLKVNAFTLDTPGANPNGDGIWTDYSFNGTVTVSGQPNGSAPLTLSRALVSAPPTKPVPEPTSAFGTIAFAIGACLSCRRLKPRSRLPFLASK